MNSNFPPNTPPVEFCALNTFHQSNKPAQFVITTAALKCSGTVCCYQKELLLCTGMWAIARQTHKHKQMLHWRFDFAMFCTNWASGRTNCPAVPALYMHCFSRYIISVLHNFVKVIPQATLWTQHLQTVQYKSSQQFRLTPRTEYQCLPFCDYSEVQEKYRLSIALHFNPQPTPFTETKHRHTIQLHILSVDTAIYT